MTMTSYPSSVVRSTVVGLFLALSVSLPAEAKTRKSAKAVVPEEPVVDLAPLTVEGSKTYVPLETGWKMAELPGFRVYSHGSGATKRIMEELQVVRAAVGLIWADERLLRQIVSVVVCDNEPEFLRWANVAPISFDRLARAVRTPSGLVLVLNGNNDGIHRVAGRVYVHGLLGGSGVPRWMKEGLAATINSAELAGDHLIVGKVGLNPMDAVPLEQLEELSMRDYYWESSSDSAITGWSHIDGIPPPLFPALRTGRQRSMGTEVAVWVDGMPPPSFVDVHWMLQEEIRRRSERRTQARGDTEFTGYLCDNIAMDLKKLFDPKAEETVAWRMNAWAFVHLSLFGEKGRYWPALTSFLQLLQRNPEQPPTKLFKEAFRVSPGSFERRMQTYARGGRYFAMDFKLERPFETKAPELAELSESNVLLLKARVYGASGRHEQARKFLQHGYGEPSNRTPSYAVALAQALRTTDHGQALWVLDMADTKGHLDNDGRRLQAELRLEKLTAVNPRLTPGELSLVLDPLFAALNGGDKSEHLFVLIGRAWQASATPPTDAQLNALRLGLQYYPKSAQIGGLLAQLEGKG